jgi:hypothetical protein
MPMQKRTHPHGGRDVLLSRYKCCVPMLLIESEDQRLPVLQVQMPVNERLHALQVQMPLNEGLPAPQVKCRVKML